MMGRRLLEWSIPQAMIAALIFGIVGSQDKDLFLVFLSGAMVGIAFVNIAVLVIFRERATGRGW